MKIKDYISGDLFLWALVLALAIFSFLPVYSASSNLAYLNGGEGDTAKYIVKHFVHLVLGLSIAYAVHKIPYNWFKGLSVMLLPFVILMLIYTALQGTTMDGANASRWIRIPVIGVGFQTSTLASVVLMTYVAKYLSGIKDKVVTFKQSLWPLWFPVAFTLIWILPSNFSTTALIFLMVLILCFIGGYPWKYLLAIIGAGIVGLGLFVLTAKAFPGLLPNRVDTWASRIASFAGDGDSDSVYQVEKAKTAIANGYPFGVGPGKSSTKHFLPQSSSDFIYAIIIEEFGLFGGLVVLAVYLFFLFRVVVIANKAETIFGSLLVIGVGLPIVIQALMNMGVAVNLFPVTGQTLPLISSGGTSIWMTCMAVGIVLSVSSKRQKLRQQENELNEEELNPLDVLSEAL
ncbi:MULTISPECIES: FtsW/RodA/SpoVE family cell cycle protein [Nonlabens]|nr:FtsW/RodA/SpoVE family cell cycle protein [Nonlabens ulvanivorans]KEZ94098.1 cell division protein FtsW [Nonlabens ulvanivorans]PRX13084.1 cell division protein FtsW [Nonlabens ulvanivorans]GAL01134.1 cell division protein FtsW [Nonlabens ulvanivorans]GAL74666.1 cell division protein FtsW [Nonlabens ulvanivorans]